MRFLAISLVVAMCRAAEPEWKAAFELADSSHTWLMQKVDGEYADPMMWLVLLPTKNPTAEEADAEESHAMALVEGGGHDDHDDHDDHRRRLEADGCIKKKPGQELHPAPDGTCYMLVVDDKKDDSTWPIDTSGLTGILMYAQHVPLEFERDRHFFYDSNDVDIEPVERVTPWGTVIGATIIVNLLTFLGVVFVVPGIGQLAKDNMPTFLPISSAFAAGALLAAAFYLMLYEATHLIAITEDRPEKLAAATWGTMILVGFITASVLDLLVFAAAGTAEASTTKDVEAVDAIAPKNKRVRILCSVLLGDFVHNLVDGFIIGIAFMGCPDRAWVITSGTIFHEIAQEISDYFVLTDPQQGALSPKIALGLNFLSGTSVIIGAVIICGIKEIDQASEGMLLAFGGGVYLQIGAAECMSKVYDQAKTMALRIGCLALFTLGAMAIGLVLISHEHCSPGGHGHGGH